MAEEVRGVLGSAHASACVTVNELAPVTRCYALQSTWPPQSVGGASRLAVVRRSSASLCMPKTTGLNARLLLTFHHILSDKKKAYIRKEARELGLHGVCKVGYPGVLAVEGREENVSTYAHGIKSLRWASCNLADHSTGLVDADLRMRKALADNMSFTGPGIVLVEKMSNVGTLMRHAGLEDWWRRAMGYSK